MPDSIIKYMEKVVDLHKTIVFNGEEMTGYEFLSSPDFCWFIMIFIGVILILLILFIRQGHENRNLAERIKRNMGQTTGRVLSIYYERTNTRAHDEPTQGTYYANIGFFLSGAERIIKVLGYGLNENESVNVFYNTHDYNDVLIERDYVRNIKDSGFKGALSFIGCFLFFMLFVVIVMFIFSSMAG